MSRLVGALAGFGRFWYDFIVGDDWTIAAGVAAALVATHMLSRGTGRAWAVVPVAALALLVLSLWRARRSA